MREPTSRTSQQQNHYAPGGLLARPRFVCLVLVLLTLAVFWPLRNCDFINYDDSEYITSNRYVQQGLTSNGIVWAFEIGYGANWHPLTWLSHMLDVDLFGIKPSGPHSVNLLFHVANTVLLFLVLRKFSRAHWRSAFVAALFALHPLHVESVAWISERKDVLSTLFWLLALWTYGRYVQSSAKDQVPSIKKWASLDYWFALLFFLLGLMSKPMLVTLPFVLLLLDYWPLERFSNVGIQDVTRKGHSGRFNSQLSIFWRLVWEKIPFFALSAISCAVTLLAQSKGRVQMADLPISARIENAFVSYGRYLGKTFWPEDLALPYPYPERWPFMDVILAVVLFIAICAAAVWWGRRLPYLFVGWFWFLGTLVPVIGLVQVGEQSMADRYTYVPLIGIFIALTWGAVAAFDRWHLSGRMMTGCGILVLGLCSMRTMDQVRYWQNSETLFRHAVAVTTNNSVATINLASYLFNHGHTDEAFREYRHALQINPEDASAYDGFGLCYLAWNRLEEAIENFNHALQINPNLPYTQANLGDTFFKRGQYVEAIACYQSALQSIPDDAETHKRLGHAFFKTGQYVEAINCYQTAIQLTPYDSDAHFDLGAALDHAGKMDDALQQYGEAVRLAPGDAEARCGFGSILARTGHREEAVAQLREALRLRPDYAEAKRALQALKVPVPE